MATAHALSAFTNSSVHQPVNPKSGLPNTLHERPIAVWEERYDDESRSEDGIGEDGLRLTARGSSPAAGAARTQARQQSESRSSGSPLRSTLSPRDPMIENLTKNLSEMTNDDFYNRLQELKAEHKKTVAMCERAYRDALTGTSSADGTTGTRVAATTASTAGVRAPSDHVRDLSRPPLPPDAKQRLAATRRSHSSEGMNESDGGEESFAEGRGGQQRRRTSRSPEANVRSRSGSLSSSGLSGSVAHIQDMWENFSVDDYAPRSQGGGRGGGAGGSSVSLRDHGLGRSQRRPTSASSSSNKENTANEWSPKITVPQPFRMTMRDEAKTTKKRTKAQEELDRSIKEKRIREEAECQKKFKATPAPANIYLPLYDEIVEKQQTRRDMNHVQRSELLRSIEKPFKFQQREEQKMRTKLTKSMPDLSSEDVVIARDATEFKARPVPKEVREQMLDRLAEEEEYRRIRMRMRAEDLLRSARLPPSMEARELGRAASLRASESEDEGDRSTARRQLVPGQPTFRPKIKHEVPDFEVLHRKLQWELAQRKDEKEPTVAKPFTLRTERIASHLDKVQQDIEEDERRLAELRWPYKNPRTKPDNIGVVCRPADQIPATQTTASTELRKSSTKEKLDKLTRRELEELEAIRRSREYDRELKRAVSEKVAANEVIYNLKDQSAEKLRRYRVEEKARQEEYRKNLNEMKQRVENRPLLFEMVTQKNARLNAERKYERTIKSAGLRDEFVRGKAAAASAAGRDDDDDDHYDDDHYDENGINRMRAEDDGSLAGSYRESIRQASRLEEARRPPMTKEETGLSDDDGSNRSGSDSDA